MVFTTSSCLRFLPLIVGLILLTSGCGQSDRQIASVQFPLYSECERYVTDLFNAPEFKGVLEAEIVHFSEVYKFSHGLIGYVKIRSGKIDKEQLRNYANNPKANCYPNAYIEGDLVKSNGDSILGAVHAAKSFHHAEKVYVVVEGNKYFVHFKK